MRNENARKNKLGVGHGGTKQGRDDGIKHKVKMHSPIPTCLLHVTATAALTPSPVSLYDFVLIITYHIHMTT